MRLKAGYEKLVILLLFVAVYFVSLLQASYRVQLFLLAGVLMLLYPLLKQKRQLRMDAMTWLWLATFAVVVIFMAMASFDQFYLLFYAVFALLILFLRDHPAEWGQWGINIVFAMGIFYAGFTVIQVTLGDIYTAYLAPLLVYNSTFDPVRYMRFGIYSGLTYQTAVNATYLAMGIGAAFSKFLLSEKKKWRYLAVIAVEIVCIMLTAKRAHLLFGGMAVLITAFVNSKRSRRFATLLGTTGVLFVLLMIAYYFVPPVTVFFDRVFSPTDDITNGRLDRYAPALEYFKAHPLFGIGWEQFRHRYIRYSDVHNIYLQLLCETGITGTAVFISAFVLTLVKTLKRLNMAIRLKLLNERYLLSFSLFGQVFFLLYGLTGNGLYDYYVVFFYMFSTLITVNCSERRMAGKI